MNKVHIIAQPRNITAGLTGRQNRELRKKSRPLEVTLNHKLRKPRGELQTTVEFIVGTDLVHSLGTNQQDSNTRRMNKDILHRIITLHSLSCEIQIPL